MNYESYDMECSSEDLKYMIELIVESEALGAISLPPSSLSPTPILRTQHATAAQRYQDFITINKDVNDLMGKIKRGTLRKSFFGMGTPKKQFTYNARKHFKTVDINEIYEKWRMSMNVTDSEDNKLRRFIRHMMSEVATNPLDVF
ncbi:hypothetical protein RB195_011563 [Necator americanus]|uniref:Uncharacterized protein n=1 Tax=Necator americanus TaxID=51031 RepID=A0ABR1D2Z3_NECAM